MAREYKSTSKNIKKYLENAKERIESAQGLLKMGNYNDAISRAYYAFFDAASAALLSRGIFAKTHKGVEMLFEKNFIKTGDFSIGIGRWLGRAREAREEADYDLWKKFTREQVRAAINAAREFVNAVEKLIKNT